MLNLQFAGKILLLDNELGVGEELRVTQEHHVAYYISMFHAFSWVPAGLKIHSFPKELHFQFLNVLVKR